jgi:hypothetical protein
MSAVPTSWHKGEGKTVAGESSVNKKARPADLAGRWLWALSSAAGLCFFAWWLLHRSLRGADAVAYYVFDLEDPYASAMGGVSGLGAFRYGPPIALGLVPFRLLPYELFLAILFVGLAACLVYLTGRWAMAALLFLPVTLDLEFGNIHLALAAAMVAGLRWPALWAFVLLTKVTPGVGLLWFVFRREWRNLAIALGVTALLAVGSFVIRPDLWPEWIAMLASAAGTEPTMDSWWVPVPLALRLPVAVALIAWGARTDRPWTVPLAGVLALPTLWIAGLAMVAGLGRSKAGLGEPSRSLEAVVVDAKDARRGLLVKEPGLDVLVVPRP